tara:strand:- start:5045 stop:6706 length:1662 start_codon:yes stop_codon:yes gene_type:complete
MASISKDILDHVKKYAFAYFNEKVLVLYDEVSEYINENDSSSDDDDDKKVGNQYKDGTHESFIQLRKYFDNHDGDKEIDHEYLYKYYTQIFESIQQDLNIRNDEVNNMPNSTIFNEEIEIINYYEINYFEPLTYFKKYLDNVNNNKKDLFNINKICELSLDKFSNELKNNGILDIKKATAFLRNPTDKEQKKQKNILRNIWLLLMEYFDYLEGKMGYKISMYEPYIINRLYISEILISESIFYANSLQFKNRVGEVNRELLKQLEEVKKYHKTKEKPEIFTITDEPDANGNWWTLTVLNTDKKTSDEKDVSSEKLEVVQSPLRALEQSPLRAMKTIRRYPKNAEDCLDVKSGILEDSDLSVISKDGKDLIDKYDNAICKLQEERKNNLDLLLEAIENGNSEQQEEIKKQLKDNIKIYKTKNDQLIEAMEKLSSNSLQKLEYVKNKIKKDVEKDQLEITVKNITDYIIQNPKLFQSKITDYFNKLEKQEKRRDSTLTRQWSISGTEKGKKGGKKTKKKRKHRRKKTRKRRKKTRKRKKSKKRKKRRKKRKTRKY